jgi:6-phosphogluconolactonase
MEWDKWFVFFADERAVPLDDKDSNFKACDEHFFSKVKIPEDQIFKIKEQWRDSSLTTKDLAVDYQKRMAKTFGMSFTPSFDLILLGMGPDGHTASLFPQHKLLRSNGIVEPIEDSPKPPSKRITLTLATINAARQVAFVATGGSKSSILRDILSNDPDVQCGDDIACKNLPSARVKPRRDAELHWFVDHEATSSMDFKNKDHDDFLGLGLTAGKLEL